MKAPGKHLLSKLFRNCAEPRGALGRLMLRMMNRGHRRVYAWTFDHCPLADGMRTLDVGCGGGGAILELARRFPAIRADGVDVSEESVAMCRRRVAAADIANPGEIVRGEAGALPMADATYDLAYAIETVYFWPDLVAGLSPSSAPIPSPPRGGWTSSVGWRCGPRSRSPPPSERPVSPTSRSSGNRRAAPRSAGCTASSDSRPRSAARAAIEHRPTRGADAPRAGQAGPASEAS